MSFGAAGWRWLALMLLTGSVPALAWDREGHRLTALVAEAYLTPAAQEEVHALLGKEMLADVAPWAVPLRLLRRGCIALPSGGRSLDSVGGQIDDL